MLAGICILVFPMISVRYCLSHKYFINSYLIALLFMSPYIVLSVYSIIIIFQVPHYFRYYYLCHTRSIKDFKFFILRPGVVDWTKAAIFTGIFWMYQCVVYPTFFTAVYACLFIIRLKSYVFYLFSEQSLTLYLSVLKFLCLKAILY